MKKTENKHDVVKKIENNDALLELCEYCANQLLTWGTLSGQQKLKRFIRKNLLRQAVAPIDHWFWPQAMLADGIFCAVKNGVPEGEKYLKTLENYYDMWISSGQKIHYVDNAMHGMPLLDLYEQTGKEKYLNAAVKLADYLKQYPLDTKGNLVYRLKDANQVYADALGMICPFLCRYGELTDNEELIDLTVRQLANFLQYGMDERSGFPYHGYDSKTGVKQGCIGWGRATGWLMMGLCGCLRYLPQEHPQYDALWKAEQVLEARIWSYQRADGGFSWLLPAVDGPADTSAAAMILGSILELKSDVKTATDIETGRIERLVEFLQKHTLNGKVDSASGECEGFGQYPQKYGAYPWGNGSVLKVNLLMLYDEFNLYSDR